MLAALSTPFAISGTSIAISASIGVTLYPTDGSDADTLLRHADQAMYTAKQAGRNRFHLFDPESDRRARARRDEVSRIRQGLIEGEFVLHYQPKVNMREGRVLGAEALIRWQHPEQGLLDAVNDLPGALIHLRAALAPGGLVIAHFIGGQSLPALRAAMLAAEPDRPAARLHPLVDPRAAPALLQRAGWKDPVVDTHALAVRYSALDRLVADLRDSGLGNALAKPAAPLGKAALIRARAAFAARADADGKTPETFEIVTLTGRRSLAGT